MGNKITAVLRDETRRVLVDSSFLMRCAQDGKDYLSMLGNMLQTDEFFTTRAALEELKRLAEFGRPSKAARARVALQMLRRVRVLDVEGESVDDTILEASKTGEFVVATGDRDLRRKLRERGVMVAVVSKDGSVKLVA